MQGFLLVIHIVLAISLIVLVLMQHGKGANLGASFGAGASGGMFGPAGSANALSRATAVVIAGFFAVSLLIAVDSKQSAKRAVNFFDEGIVNEINNDAGNGLLDDALNIPSPTEDTTSLTPPLE